MQPVRRRHSSRQFRFENATFQRLRRIMLPATFRTCIKVRLINSKLYRPELQVYAQIVEYTSPPIFQCFGPNQVFPFPLVTSSLFTLVLGHLLPIFTKIIDNLFIATKVRLSQFSRVTRFFLRNFETSFLEERREL